MQTQDMNLDKEWHTNLLCGVKNNIKNMAK